MADAEPRTPSKMTRLREAVQAIGPGVDLAAVRARLVDVDFSMSEYYKARGQVFPHLIRRYGFGATADGPAGPTPPLPVVPAIAAVTLPPLELSAPGTGNDYLSRFIRFGVAVEAVGGVANAERMLDAIKRLTGAQS